MSLRTKHRRRHRRVVRGLADLIRHEPRRSDPGFEGEFGFMAYCAAHMRWEMAHNMAMMCRSYSEARALAYPEL